MKEICNQSNPSIRRPYNFKSD